MDETLPFVSGSESELDIKPDTEMAEILLRLLILY